MHGKIISFNIHERQGAIIADDGIQYIFNIDSWAEQEAPRAGENIDFTLNEIGQVDRVARLSTHAATPPPIPPSLHKQPQNHSTPPAQAFNNNRNQNFNNESFNNESFNNQNVNNQSDSAAIDAQEENYNIVDWTKKVILGNYLNFKGRARRKEYWWFYLASVGVMIGAMIIDAIIGSDGVFYSLSILALFLPSLGVTVRRLHDTGRSGWNVLWGIIPLVGAILLIIWLASDTSPQHNQYGAPARDI